MIKFFNGENNKVFWRVIKYKINMSMFWELISAFLGSIWSVFNKKALDKTNMDNYLFVIFWPLIWFWYLF